MKIVTLISDLGDRDWYVAKLKGKLLGNSDEPIQFVDVTHKIPSFDIERGVFVMKNILNSYPEGTIHLFLIRSMLHISPDGTLSNTPLLAKTLNGQVIIGPNNGFLSLLKDDVTVFSTPLELSAKEIDTVGVYSKFTSEYLFKGIDAFSEVSDYSKFYVPLASEGENLISGTIQYIDHYGNAYTNITKEVFDRIGQGSPFEIRLRNKEYVIDKISRSINEVEHGEMVGIFSSSGYLKVMISHGTRLNGGGAADLLGLKPRDSIMVSFTPRGSIDSLESLFQ